MFRNRQNKKLQQSQECLITGSLGTLLRLSQVVGVAPLRMARVEGGWHASLSPRLALFQCLFITTLDLVLITALVLDLNLEPHQRVRLGATTLTGAVWVSDMLIIMLISNMGVFGAYTRMRNIFRLIKQIQKINVDLKSKGASAKTERTRLIFISIFLLLKFIVELSDFRSFLRTAMDAHRQWFIMIMFGLYYYESLLTVIVAMQWVLVTLHIRDSFAALNDTLQQIVVLNEGYLSPFSVPTDFYLKSPSTINILVDSFTLRDKISKAGPTFSKPNHENICDLARSYEMLCDAVRQLNDASGPILLLALMSIFLHLVITPYYLLLGLVNEAVSLRAEVLALQLTWCFYHFCKLLLFVEPCHWTHKQIERTRILASKISIRLTWRSERLAREISLFCQQMLLNTVSISPLGVYDVGRPLTATIIGGVTTYLVIIIQFQAISEQL